MSSASHPALRATVSAHRPMDPEQDLYPELCQDRTQLAPDSLWHRAMGLADRMAAEGQGEGSGEEEEWGLTAREDMYYPRHLQSLGVKTLDWGATSGVEGQDTAEMEIELARAREENLVLKKKVGLLEARQLHGKKEDSRRRQEAEQENKVSLTGEDCTRACNIMLFLFPNFCCFLSGNSVASSQMIRTTPYCSGSQLLGSALKP